MFARVGLALGIGTALFWGGMVNHATAQSAAGLPQAREQRSSEENGGLGNEPANPSRPNDIEVAVEIRLVSLAMGNRSTIDFYKEGRDLSDIQVFQFLESVQGDRSLNVMQAPKMKVFTSHKGQVSFIDEHTYVTGVKIVGEKENLMAIAETEKVALGFRFTAQPTVSSDLRYVNLDLGIYLANLEEPVSTRLVDTPAPKGKRGQIVIELPKVSKIEMQRTLKIADGGTKIVPLGKKMTEAHAEAAPPILAKIPYLNRLFLYTASGREMTELFAFVTTRIITSEEEGQVFRK